MTWEEARDAAGPGSVAILPVGAIEAHGPHLPLETDVIIAQAMARSGAARLAARGLRVVVLPPLTYTAAAFARGFAGTLSLRPETVTATVLDIAGSLTRHGFGVLAIANAHLDPGPPRVAGGGRERDPTRPAGSAVAFPNLAAKPWALRLSDEFKSGACHAGQFETSIVLAERPDLVREATMAALPPNPASLSRAIREGKHELRGGRRPPGLLRLSGAGDRRGRPRDDRGPRRDPRRGGPGRARRRTGSRHEPWPAGWRW